jgi:hypothetical protein
MMTFGEVMEAIAERLMCNACLSLYHREPETMLGDYCPRCAPKLCGMEYRELFLEYTKDWNTEEDMRRADEALKGEQR